MVRAEICRLGLQNDVVMAGKRSYEEIPSLYHHALLNLFASECENCPNILLEAMAAGRPLLVSSRPPMPEFAGTAAIYFDPKSPVDLASKLVSVLDNSLWMSELAAKAKKRSLLYDWQSTARRTWDAIETLT
jgi:glycosyltransferase involved in cell wall biosynthesis